MKERNTADDVGLCVYVDGYFAFDDNIFGRCDWRPRTRIDATGQQHTDSSIKGAVQYVMSQQGAHPLNVSYMPYATCEASPSPKAYKFTLIHIT